MSISIPPRIGPAVAKAGPVGPGSGVLQTEFPLERIGRESAQKRMRRAWALSFEVPWVAAAEDAITERFAGVEWHLEDEQDETIDDSYPSPDAQAARTLMEKPSTNVSVGAPYYRSDLWALTARAMGICGSAFIYLDQPEALAGTPSAMLPIAPWRMFPADDANGNLTGWAIDKTPTSPGIAVSLEQILHYQLRRNFTGHFGVGLMESAMRKINISQGLDDHVALILSAGGRLSGILSPSSGIIGDETIIQMERDWRTIVEQQDAAKRLQLVRAPIKFDRTTLTPDEMQVRDLMVGARDDLLALWGVPLSIIGGSTPAGLNSGDTRKYDEAAIWQGPVHHRLNVFREVTQYQLLDRYEVRGATVELEIDEPEFDDDSPRYDLLQKSLNTPMRSVERRALINLPPFGVPALDDQIILPASLIPFGMAPSEPDAPVASAAPGYRPETQPAANDPATAAAGEQGMAQPNNLAEGKARFGKQDVGAQQAAMHTSLVALRTNIHRTTEARVQWSVDAVLKAQRTDIAARIRKHASAIERKPNDASIWFDGKKWDAELESGAPADPGHDGDVRRTPHRGRPEHERADMMDHPSTAVDHVLKKGAARVTGINETTRAKIQEALSRGIGENMTVLQVADAIESGGMVAGLDMGSLFDSFRAEMVARTEMMSAYNAAALASYTDAGIEKVQAIDGDGDEECAARDGEIFDLEEADAIEDHPNGTLDWVPVTFAPVEVPEEMALEPVPEAPDTAPTDGSLLQAAQNLVELATRTEPAVTRDLIAIGESTDLNINAAFRLEGQKFNTLGARLKTEGSTARKVATEARLNPEATTRQIADSMKDNLRYTYIAQPDAEAFARSVQEAVDEMAARGYEPLRATNYFAHEDGYAGLNTNWRAPDGQLFEVQFHTQAGLETKEVMSHPLYEELRVLPPDSPEAAAINAKVDDLWRAWRAENPGLGQNLGFLREVFPVVR